MISIIERISVVKYIDSPELKRLMNDTSDILYRDPRRQAATI
jgi:hypothetical protein